MLKVISEIQHNNDADGTEYEVRRSVYVIDGVTRGYVAIRSIGPTGRRIVAVWRADDITAPEGHPAHAFFG